MPQDGRDRHRSRKGKAQARPRPLEGAGLLPFPPVPAFIARKPLGALRAGQDVKSRLRCLTQPPHRSTTHPNFIGNPAHAHALFP